MASSRGPTVTALVPRPTASPPDHHVGDPPTSFCNPWPSFRKESSFLDLLRIRFSSDRNFVPVPSRDELVQVHKPEWGRGHAGLKATWIGHASFLVELTAAANAPRGIRVLFDPVFSERTSPVQWFGPKRYTPTPCTLDEVPEVDLVVISHSHYDHLDAHTVRYLHENRGEQMHFFCGLGNKKWFGGIGISDNRVTEMDWWDGVRVQVDGVGALELYCTPSQHFSGRTPWDMGSTLWCSWVVKEIDNGGSSQDGDVVQLGKDAEPTATDGRMDSTTLVQKSNSPTRSSSQIRNLFFAGDTGYRSVPLDHNPDESEDIYPHCPAFKQIGDTFGPFSLALLPIGLYSPRHFMSPVHCNPEDSLCIHKDIKSKKSIGMHWGTVRGGLSAQYEDVREPPRRWKEACEREGFKWGEEVGLLDIGETIIIS